MTTTSRGGGAHVVESGLVESVLFVNGVHVDADRQQASLWCWCREHQDEDRDPCEIKLSRCQPGRAATGFADGGNDVASEATAMEVESDGPAPAHRLAYPRGEICPGNGAERVVEVAVVEHDPSQQGGSAKSTTVVCGLSSGRVILWALSANEVAGASDTPPRMEARITSSSSLVYLGVVSSAPWKTDCVYCTSDRGVGQLAFDMKTGVWTASNLAKPRQEDAEGEDKAGGETSGEGGKGIFQNVFGSLVRFQGGSARGAERAGGSRHGSGRGPCEAHSMALVRCGGGDVVLAAVDMDGDLWCYGGLDHSDSGSTGVSSASVEVVSLKDACVQPLDLASWSPANRQPVDHDAVVVKPLDVSPVKGGGTLAVLAVVEAKESFQKVGVFLFDVSGGRRPTVRFVRHVLLSDAWLSGSLGTLRLKLKIASDGKSFVIKGTDGQAIAFAGDLKTATEVAAIHMNKYIWDVCPFALPGRAHFLLLMHDLSQITLSRALLDMCYNIVEALPKQRSDPGAGAGDGGAHASALDAQLKDKVDQHFHFVSLLHSRGWLDMVDMKTAGRIVRAGERITALQCIKTKENLLLEPSAQDQRVVGLATSPTTTSGSTSKSLPLALLQSIIRETGAKVGQTRSAQAAQAPSQSAWEVFYSKPTSSVLFLDTLAEKVGALIHGPNFEIMPGVTATAMDVHAQNAVLNVLSRTVTETMNSVESWIRVVDRHCIPALPGAFGHQEGYSWTSCPSLCDALLALSRLCIHYHTQWKTKAPTMVPRLSIQLHSLITQYLSVMEAFLAATPEEEKRANPQRLRAYVESGEEVLGALLSASYEEANHMIQDAVAELAEVHSCYGVLYDLCDKTKDIGRLYQYMRMVEPFATYAFMRLVAANRIRDILELPEEFNQGLCLYLKQHGDPRHQELLWLHLARMQSWGDCAALLESSGNTAATQEKKERDLALSKLCKLAQRIVK